MLYIDLEKDFSAFPFGMLKGDGDSSGYFFRKNIFLPALNDTSDLIIIEINTAAGLGSSFVTGAFSLIISEINPITKKNYTAKEIESRVKFIDKTKSYSEIPTIWEYMYDIENTSYPNHNKNPCKGDVISYLNEKFTALSISKCRCYINILDNKKEKQILVKDCKVLIKFDNNSQG